MIADYTDNKLTPWVQSLPVDWSVCCLSNVSDILFSNVDKHVVDGEISVRLCNYTDVYNNEIITTDMNFMEATALPREIDRFQLRKGDVLATKDSESWDDIAIAARVAEELPGVLCGYHLAVLRARSRRITGEYLGWLYQSKQFRAQYEAKAVGVTRFGLGQSSFKQTLIPLPLPSEQRCIAAYLDHACASIDGTIKAKQKQLESLAELRESIIHKAVTRGLDDSVELKDSGVEWLGKIPKHWRVDKLKRLLNTPLMYGTNEPGDIDIPEYPRYVRITDFDDSGNLREDTFKSLPPEKAEGYYLSDGDILLARSGATVGKTFYFSEFEGQACFAGYLIKVQTDTNRLLPNFFYFYTKSLEYDTWKSLTFTQATIQNISARRYGYLVVPVPPKEEQMRIVKHMQRKLQETNRIESNIMSQISALTDYRKSLIHECVTGKRRISEADIRKVSAHD